MFDTLNYRQFFSLVIDNLDLKQKLRSMYEWFIFEDNNNNHHVTIDHHHKAESHHHYHHGHHNNHHLLDRQALRFRCPIGYRLIGSSLIKCDHIHNEWSETFPKCQRKYRFIYSFIQ